MEKIGMGAPGGVEPPTNGLGNRCSVHLSYGATLQEAKSLVNSVEDAMSRKPQG